jgi:glycosyltransferase involved in cell wall biosynthesis
MNKITCIIPYFNEQKRIFETLKTVTKLQNLHQIICVDDGSDDKNYLEIEKRYPTKIKVIRLSKNQGKSAAVYQGLKQVTTPWVMLLDADLQNIKLSEFQNAIDSVTTADPKTLDMIILRRSWYSIFVTAIRHDILMSGERILKTTDLLNVFEHPIGKKPPTGYQLEIAINLYMMNHQKKCYWLQTSLKNSYKINKWGLEKSLGKYWDEVSGYTGYAGLGNYLKQLILFCNWKYLPNRE